MHQELCAPIPILVYSVATKKDELPLAVDNFIHLRILGSPSEFSLQLVHAFGGLLHTTQSVFTDTHIHTHSNSIKCIYIYSTEIIFKFSFM